MVAAKSEELRVSISKPRECRCTSFSQMQKLPLRGSGSFYEAESKSSSSRWSGTVRISIGPSGSPSSIFIAATPITGRSISSISLGFSSESF